MNRAPLILVDIGAPAPAPVTPAPTYWAARFGQPVVQAMPPALPTGFLAAGIAGGVLLRVTGSQHPDNQYIFERAADVDGTPGAWVEIARQYSLIFTDTDVSTPTHWYRAKALAPNQRSSDWTQAVLATAQPVPSKESVDQAQQSADDAKQDVLDLAADMQSTFDKVNQDVAQAQADADAASDYAHQQAAALQGQVDVLTGQIGDIMSADEWDSGKTYPLGDLVQSGGYLYRSLKDNNTAALTDAASWEKIGQYTSLGAAVGDAVARVNLHDIDIQNNEDAITVNASDLALLGAHNAGKTAFVLDQSTVKIGSQTLAQYISSVQSSIGDVDARVDSEQQARVDGDSANALDIASVRTSIQPSTNFLVNSMPRNSTEGWKSAGPCTLSVVRHSDGFWLTVTRTGPGTMSLYQDRPGSVSGSFAFSADVRSGGSASNAGRLAADIEWVVNGSTAGNTPDGDVTVSGAYDGARLESHGSAPAGLTAIRARVFTTDDDISVFQVRLAKLEAGTSPTIWRPDEDVSANSNAIVVMSSEIQQHGNDITALSQTVQQNTSNIGDKLDASAISNYYTKAQTDGQISSSAAGLTQSFNASLATTNANVTAEQQARVDGDSANSQAITAVQSSIQPGVNLLTNSMPRYSTEGWRSSGPCTLSTQYHSSGYWLLVTRTGPGTIFLYQDVLGSRSGTFVFAAGVRSGAGSNAGTLHLDMQWVGGPSDGTNTVDGSTVVSGQYQGGQLVSSGSAPSGITAIRPRVFTTDDAIDKFEVRLAKLEAGSTPTVWRADEDVARSAQVVQSLTAGVNADGKSYAQATTLVDANGRIGGTRLSSDGTVSAFDVVADRFSVTPSSGSGARMEWSDNALKVHDSSNKLRIFIGLK